MFGSEADKRIPVTITLASGEILRGSVPSSASASLAFELNREGLFLNVKDTTGKIVFIAKANIHQVVEGNEEKQAVLPELARGQSPHKVLRVSEDASPEVIRQAYMALAKIYHPDNYPTDSTAPELADYVAAMFQQITVAYTALKAVAAKAA
jgi:DnaJ-domain-containing protein 1